MSTDKKTKPPVGTITMSDDRVVKRTTGTAPKKSVQGLQGKSLSAVQYGTRHAIYGGQLAKDTGSRRMPSPPGMPSREAVKREPDFGKLTTRVTERPSKSLNGKPPSHIEYAPGLLEIVEHSELLARRVRQLCKSVVFSVETSTVSGKRFPYNALPDAKINFNEYIPDNNVRHDVIARLTAEGFSLLHEGIFSTSLSGTAKDLQRYFGISLRLFAAPLPAELPLRTWERDCRAPTPESLFLGLSPTSNERIRARGIEALEIAPPIKTFAARTSISSTAPQVSYHALDAAAIRRHLHVPDHGATGEGVSVAMIDSGFWDHPYFSGLDYRRQKTTVAPDPEVDQYGHGTAMAMNFFATARKASLLAFKHVDALPDVAIDSAIQSGAQIITCSWGVPPNRQLTKLIRYAVSQGVIVLFAAGNGQIQWPGNMREVISVGGVHADEFGNLQASDMANGYIAKDGRPVPDICGLCGMGPLGVYVLSPTQPGSDLDSRRAGHPHPSYDHTDADDGWVGISGTSAATAQVAGVVALLLEKAQHTPKRKLTQTDVISIFRASSRDVLSGHSAQGNPAGPSPSIACGYGLVDASAALARL